MGKKVISNTFTVNIIVDGISQQQIFTRNANAVLPPRSQSDTPTLPSGWTYTPQGVDNTHPDEYVSMRSKDSSGVWSEYSSKVPYSHYGEDGKSIKILGTAVGIDTYPTTPQQGDTVLLQSFNTDDIDVYNNGVWEGYEVEDGCGYIYQGHLWVKNSDATQKWTDVGQIKGEKGDDAVMYVLEPSIPQFNTDHERTKAQVCTVRAYKIEGKTKSAFTGCFEIAPVVPSGMIGRSSYSWGNYVSFGTNYDRNATAYDVSLWDKDPRYITVDEPEPVLLASINIPIAFDGVQGKMGRNLWFAGWWEDIKGQNFTVDDHSAPYVQTGWVDESQKTPVCKVFIGANGNNVYPSTVAGYENNVNWGAMVSDFEYLITKAIFANFAKLGSWVFNGDYMLSQTGVDGTKNYQNFTGESGQWQPNLYMNALTGRLVGNNVNLRGVFNSYDAVYWNGIEMNAQQGYFKMSGPDVVEYGGKPWSGASIVDLFKIEFKDRESVVVEGETTVRCISMTIGDEDLSHIRIDSNDYFDGAVIRLGNSSKGAAIGTKLDDGDIPKMRFWDNYYNQSGEQRSVELNAEGVRFMGGDGNYGNVRLTNEGVEVYRPNGTLWAFKSWGRIIGFE